MAGKTEFVDLVRDATRQRRRAGTQLAAPAPPPKELSRLSHWPSNRIVQWRLERLMPWKIRSWERKDWK
jgi:hypothetical protein